ncbi:MAG: hypothetical protein KJ749_15480, partial [Planctomycetes bacterium]|nr:hypothetical protein [Planctomycetota bacterium]
DGDGVPDCADNCLTEPNPDQEDCNNNAVGDACEIAQEPDKDYNENCILDECEMGSCCVESPTHPGYGLTCEDSREYALTLPECIVEDGYWYYGEFCDVDFFACPDYFVCNDATGDCYTAHPGQGCDQMECCKTVCEGNDPWCCLGEWESDCGDLAEEHCCRGIVVADSDPPSGTVDARQPHPVNSQLPRQGIGSSDEKITITLDGGCRDPILNDLFTVCETKIDALLGRNEVKSVTDLGDGVYEIELAHAITAGAVTTVAYRGYDGFAEYISHPANSNADGIASSSDLMALINCCLNHVCTPPHGDYSCDMDHSEVVNAQDVLRLIDLLNGAGEFRTWMASSLPVNTGCPTVTDGCACIAELRAGGGESTLGTGAEGSAAQDNSAFAEWFVSYVTTAWLPDEYARSEFVVIVEALTAWLGDHLPVTERESLAQALQDPGLTFTSPEAEALVARIVSRLCD